MKAKMSSLSQFILLDYLKIRISSTKFYYFNKSIIKLKNIVKMF